MNIKDVAYVYAKLKHSFLGFVNTKFISRRQFPVKTLTTFKINTKRISQFHASLFQQPPPLCNKKSRHLIIFPSVLHVPPICTSLISSLQKCFLRRVATITFKIPLLRGLLILSSATCRHIPSTSVYTHTKLQFQGQGTNISAYSHA